MSVFEGLASSIAVLGLAGLLAVEVFGVAVVTLAYVLSRPAVTPAALARAAGALLVSAVAWIGVAVLAGFLTGR